jgi:hypothetical protein
LRIADCGLNGELRRDRPACGCHPAPARAGCTNKPNWPERIMQNEPNLPPPGGQAGPWLKPIAQNKANLGKRGRDPRADYAKRTQFPAGAPFRSDADCAKRSQFASCAQEWALAAGARRPRRGLIVQNEPNSARSGQGRVSEGEGCETNPIWRGQMRETNPISEGVSSVKC